MPYDSKEIILLSGEKILLCSKTFGINMNFENLHSAEQICFCFPVYLYEAAEGPSPASAFRCDKQLINLLLLTFMISFFTYCIVASKHGSAAFIGFDIQQFLWKLKLWDHG